VEQIGAALAQQKYQDVSNAAHALKGAAGSVGAGLWVQFALRLGATKEELAEVARRPLAEVIGFPRTMTYFCRRSAAEGLASWYADEAQLPEAHGATALALRKFYGLDDETIEYFLEHVRADLGHTDSSGHLIEDYIGSGKDVARARRASASTNGSSSPSGSARLT
jgi:pyrroloquinoline quinone (PQQ) biosynthesis protein C